MAAHGSTGPLPALGHGDGSVEAMHQRPMFPLTVQPYRQQNGPTRHALCYSRDTLKRYHSTVDIARGASRYWVYLWFLVSVASAYTVPERAVPIPSEEACPKTIDTSVQASNITSVLADLVPTGSVISAVNNPGEAIACEAHFFFL